MCEFVTHLLGHTWDMLFRCGHMLQTATYKSLMLYNAWLAGRIIRGDVRAKKTSYVKNEACLVSLHPRREVLKYYKKFDYYQIIMNHQQKDVWQQNCRLKRSSPFQYTSELEEKYDVLLEDIEIEQKPPEKSSEHR